MDDMHSQLQAAGAACQQSNSLLLPPPAADRPCSSSSSSSLSLLGTAAAACLFLLIRRLLKFKGRRSKNDRRRDYNNNAAPPPPPPGRGSSWWWSVVETLAFVSANRSGRGLYHFVEARHRRYGPPCFRTALLGATHVFVSSPDAARSLLADAGGFSKRYVRTVAELLGEHSLLCASHDAHRALRRAVAPLFNAQATASLAANFDALARRIITRDWAAKTTAVVVLDAALDVTFEAICDMLIGRTTTLKRRRLQSDVLAVTRAMLAFPLRLPGTRFHAGLRARKRIMDVLRQEIASRQRNIMDMEEMEEDDSKHDNDFLQSLLLLRRRKMKSSQQQQSPSNSNDHLFLTDDQILDNILTLIIAGQVTTASAITWMVKYLADNKDFQETLRSVQLEMALKHQHGDSDGPLTLQHLNSMELAYMTVKESLRMASIVSWFPRVALEDCQVAGFHINKGWIVNIDARALHYDATLYDNPTMFDPSRFKGEDMCTKQQAPYSFLVFGAGGRTCLGMNLAKIMMLIFLHHLVTNWRWEMADDDPSLEKWAMFPRLKSGCPIHLTPI
ncbi:abscisic acid 8'-hydroxylase 4 isoform X2 [Sorghum bicolor]|uniref:abscisic acid 8'-hydroxylase 4 isoform X2 n=1 Tax=Sorghum bicolor TaxID=4558 RepID=UPI000B424E9F|nr:abscisic acid 8'-hydroxylase 4 isoform X2 [Sorghum bicolor]|eukprot:XP_021302812.1 abscisic acid 8'-hydroxylase 4 isoform X2 [Sorghum bicolor]